MAIKCLSGRYVDKDIFNADKLELLKYSTHKFKDETCKDGKLSQERITVLICASMTGSEIL